MCFSPEASFTAGAALLPAGIYCIQAAARKDVRFLPVALVPIMFGIQQISEGFVWLGLHQENTKLLQDSSVVFLFFAIPFWPIWIPLSLAIAESRRPQQIALALMAVVGLAWLWLFFPVAVDPAKWLTTEVAVRSVRYTIGEVPAFLLAPRLAWRFAYLLIISGALAVGRIDPGGSRWANVSSGMIVAVLFAATYLLYQHAFLSVWCFFAAVVSLLLCFAMRRLPVRQSGLVSAAT